MNERSFIIEGFDMVEQNSARSKRTRAAIIQAAHDLFADQGYHGTSMRQIAANAGIAQGGLYNHFESKEQVFEAVVLESHSYQEIIPALLKARGETIERFLSDALQQMVHILNEHPQFVKLMFIEVVEFQSVHAEKLFTRLMPTLASLMDTVVLNYEEQIRPIPRLVLLRYFFGFLFSYLLTDLFLVKNGSLYQNKDIEGYYVDIFLHGIFRENPISSDMSRE